MLNSKCIIAATDFSGTSRAALAVAGDVAVSTGAHLHIVHVIPDPALMPWSLDAGPAVLDLAKDWRRHAESLLERARADTGLAPCRTTLTVLMGEAAAEIVKEARTIGAGIIVIGTHGHGFVARLLMGSVADKVVRRADRPVLIVPHPALKHPQPEAIALGAEAVLA